MLRIAALALAGLISIASVAADEPNPLVGTVWSGTGAPAAHSDIEASMRAADFVLIGEIHTNAEHHATQAALIRAMVEAGRKPAVVLEMVPRSLQGELDAFLASDNPDAHELGARLNWETRGWPDWDIYQVIAEAAIAAGLPMFAGDLDRNTIRAIGRGEEKFVPAAEYSEATRERLAEELRVSHCNLLPEQAIAPMIAVQLARDAAMAEAMLDHAGSDGAVLIAGGGHARADWGVPFILKAKAPEKTVVSIGQFEVSEGETQFADYAENGETGLPYDFVMFTARGDDTDHCAELKEKMGK